MIRRTALSTILLVAACGSDPSGPDGGGPGAPGGVIGQATVGASGGTLTVSIPGDALNGMTIAVPAGTYNTSSQITVRKSGATAPSRAGVRIASAVIAIEASSGASATGKPVELSIPAAYGPNEYPFVMLFDPATGERSILPTIPMAGSRVIAQLPLVGGGSAQSAGQASLRSGSTAMMDNPVIHLVIGAIPLQELANDLDSGYRPEIDDWDFDRLLTAAMDDEFRYANGAAISAAWYYDRFKGSRGALKGRFQKAPGIEFSNVDGFRLVTALIEPMLRNSPAVLRYHISLITAMVKFETAEYSVDSLTLLSVKAGIYATGRPQVLMAGDLDTPDAPDAMLIAYRTRGSAIDISLGTSAAGPNAPRTLTLVNGNFAPITWASKDPLSGAYTNYTAKEIMSTGPTATLSAALLNSSWQATFEGTIGDDIFPTWQLVSKAKRPIPDTVFVAEDSVRVWLECPNCEAGLAVREGITPQGKVQPAILVRKGDDGKWNRQANGLDGNGALFKEEHDGFHMGMVVLEQADDGLAAYLDWHEFQVAVRKLDVTPKNAEVAPNTQLTLTATSDRTLPTSPTWEWELGDGRKIATSSNVAVFSYPPPEDGAPEKEYEVKARLLSAGVAYATGKTKVKVKVDGAPHWKITQFADAEGFFDDPEVGGGEDEVRNTFLRVLSTPGAGMISVDEVPGGSTLRLRVLKSTEWNAATQCCPPPAPSGGEFAPFILGTKPSMTFAVGPYFAAWNSSNWNQSTTDLSTGTMTGQYVHSTMSYDIEDIGTQTGPTGGIRITATRSGTTMTGNISITIWWINDETGEVDTPPETYLFPFTAVRMK